MLYRGLFLIGLLAFSAQPTFAQAPKATPIEAIKTPEGFKVELLYSVPPEEQGSWVSLTTDDRGRLITSDQYGKLYRITPPALGAAADATQIETIPVEIGMAQGLLYAFDSLYVVVNGDGAGLYRVRDTNGDDQYDEVKKLRAFEGAGEHGPHAVILSPDGKSLFVAGGNHTKLPEIATSRVPQNWQEDQLLPRMWDAGGHAVGIMAPGGWVCKTDPEGKEFELYASGFRNEYDIAFNMEGELFTYDADMEWDVGAPWYRPTRVCHVTSGAEFGWRSGSGKWPSYYPDSLPGAVNVGPGSPTGIAFGTLAKFPEKYQRALFIADWSYGIIYAVHLDPHGSTYQGSLERFVLAAPLPVTDMVVNQGDGAMYFTIGGRRTQSGLYRVTYVGSESTAAVEPRKYEATAENLRELRHRLEAFHTDKEYPQALEVAWKNLGHEDRFVRYAARVAVEHQPVASWQDKALAEKEPWAAVHSLLALARCGDKSLRGKIVDRLASLGWKSLDDENLRLAMLRVYGVTFARMGAPEAAERKKVLAQINDQYPSRSTTLNYELSRVLIYLEAPEVAGRTLKLLATAPTQEEQIHYAFSLRTLKTGWTPEQRKEYFSWFNQATTHRGGHSLVGFLNNTRTEAVATLSEDEKKSFADIINVAPTSPTIETPQREFVQKWTVEDLVAAIENEDGERNLERGRELFAAATCFKCHRFDGQGGNTGPDLTGVAGRFNLQNLLESIVEPSKVISDQYASTSFILDDGRTVTGRVANLSGNTLLVVENMLDPGRLTGVERNTIEEMIPSSVSQMPTGLLDTFTKDEILDLIAYLRSGRELARQ